MTDTMESDDINNLKSEGVSLDEDCPPEKRQKFENFKGKKRGQNKSRPAPFKEDRGIKLCKSLIDGIQENVKNCTFQNCIFIHSIEQFLKEKSEDLEGPCYIYSVRGYCPFGLTCRFVKNHIDESGKNLRSEKYDENAPPTTFNQVGNELQTKLRRKQYNFDLARKVVNKYETERSKSLNKVEEIVDNDSDKIKDDEPKNPLDLHNKLLLSPLTTVGNLPFRRICKEYGADVTCGEMACSLPIIQGASGEWALIKRHESEDIFGVQLCGNKSNIIACAAQVLKENAKIDFIDLNLGCPIDLIYKQGGGSALLRRWNVLEVTIKACKEILNGIPITVKTRTGIYADKSVAHELVPKFEEWGASLVTIHGRSREQRYTKTADWEYVEKCAQQAKNIPIYGNGDILSYDDYKESRIKSPSTSGVMIGRGALIKPWIFQEIKEQRTLDPSGKERFEMLQKYVNYGLEHWGSDIKGVENTRRFLLEWQSFLYRYVPHGIIINPPQKINERADCLEYRDDMEKLLASGNCADWIKLSEMLLGKVPNGFQFLPKHRANSY